MFVRGGARVAMALAAGALVLAIGASSVAADTQGPRVLCTGDPELPGVQFTCQQLSVRLAGDADIDEVIARSAPSATVIGLDISGAWNLHVPAGEEPSVRDALREDPDVASVSLWYFGYLSGADGVPDTATTAPVVRVDTMVLGFVMLAAGALVRTRFRRADGLSITARRPPRRRGS